MVVGVLLGHFTPAPPEQLARFESARVSVPMAILIWVMIYPMMLKVDFNSMETLQMNRKADYGNWVPAAMIKTLWAATAAISLVSVLMFVLIKSPVPGFIGIVVTLAALCMTIYMQRCRKLFDFQGGGRPKIYFVPLDRRLLGVFWYE